MKELNSKDSRIAYFFNSLNRMTIKLESLLVNHKPLFNDDRYLTDEELFLKYWMLRIIRLGNKNKI